MTTSMSVLFIQVYCRAEMYAGRVACCLLVSHGEYADARDREADRRTDARLLHYAFRFRRGERNNKYCYTVNQFLQKINHTVSIVSS